LRLLIFERKSLAARLFWFRQSLKLEKPRATRERSANSRSDA